MDETKFIAAILTSAALRGDTTHSPEQVIAAYLKLLGELRLKDEERDE